MQFSDYVLRSKTQSRSNVDILHTNSIFTANIRITALAWGRGKTFNMSARLSLNASLVLARHSWQWWLVHWGMLPCFSSREDSTAPAARWQLLPRNSLRAKAAAAQPLKHLQRGNTSSSWLLRLPTAKVPLWREISSQAPKFSFTLTDNPFPKTLTQTCWS